MDSRSHKKFLLVTILPQTMTDTQALEDLKEVKSLVETYGGEVCDLIVQRREIHDKGMYVGKGKLQEIVKVVVNLSIDIVVLNGIVRAGQIFEIKNELQKETFAIEVWDRVDLILEIFALHAHTAESKLQIELASMRHMGPRIYGMGMVLSRQGGGIGTLGVGETNTELMKRHWKQQIKKIQGKLNKHVDERRRQLIRREKNGVQTVSIVGYTNAGKTSLFNHLTNKKNLVENSLFVTLDSSSGKVFLPNLKKEVLFSDTIGFIQNLPLTLIEAFTSTLLESMHADVLLFVIDSSDENMEKKIRVVEKILYGLMIERKKRIYVFSKIDIHNVHRKEDIWEDFKQYDPQFISVKTGVGISQLLRTVEKALQHQPTEQTISSPRRKIVHV